MSPHHHQISDMLFIASCLLLQHIDLLQAGGRNAHSCGKQAVAAAAGRCELQASLLCKRLPAFTFCKSLMSAMLFECDPVWRDLPREVACAETTTAIGPLQGCKH